MYVCKLLAVKIYGGAYSEAEKTRSSHAQIISTVRVIFPVEFNSSIVRKIGDM